MSIYKISFGSGVTIDIEESDGKVSSVNWGGSDADQIKSGIFIQVGMKSSGVVPALEKFGWDFEEVEEPKVVKKAKK